MDNLNKSVHILKENHSPSFFQNACTGNKCEEEGRVGARPENNASDRDRPTSQEVVLGTHGFLVVLTTTKSRAIFHFTLSCNSLVRPKALH